MAALSVIVPARNAAATLGVTLAALAAQDVDEPFEVIVVNDGSTDGTAAVAGAARLAPRVIASTGAGAAAARNTGARESTGPLLAFTDADCEPAPGWLRAGMRALQSADLVQGRVEPARRLQAPFERTLDVRRLTGLYESANVFVRRDVFERVGGFEQWLGGRSERPFGEDSLFGWRAHRAGARIVFAADAVVHHAVFPGTWRDLVRERWRLRYFPPLVALVPELRDHLVSRWFVAHRTAKYDLAIAGVVVAARSGRTLALAAVVPYARFTYGYARLWGRRRTPLVFLALVASDTVGAGALVLGSARAQTLVV